MKAKYILDKSDNNLKISFLLFGIRAILIVQKYNLMNFRRR